MALFHTREEGRGVHFLPWLLCVLLDTPRQLSASCEGVRGATLSLLEQRVSRGWGPHVLSSMRLSQEERALWCDLRGARKLFFI